VDQFLKQLREYADRMRSQLEQWLESFRRSRSGAPRDDDSLEPGEVRRRSAARDTARRIPDRSIGAESAVVVASADDDVASVVGRIDTADSAEVVLVVRRDARALRRATAWPHIAAHVRRRGIELGVVSPRGDVRAYARDNGLRAARGPRGLRSRERQIRIGEREFPLPAIPWASLLRGVVALAIFGVLFSVACYQIPTAQVYLVPASEEFQATGSARPNAVVASSDLGTQTITANTVRHQVITAVTTSTTGEVEIGDEFATLELEFTNDSSTVILVPLGTRVLNVDDISFLTDENIDVPANGTARVTATAEFPGSAGNISVDSISEVEHSSPALSVTNVTSGAGGTNQLTAGVAIEDVERAREIADRVLLGVGTSSLRGLVEEDELGTLIESSVTVAIFSEQPVQLLDEPSDVLIVEYTIIAAGLIITPAQANAYGELLVRDSLPEGRALLPGSVVATVVPSPERGEPVTVEAIGRIASLDGIAEVAGQLTGKSPAEAERLLQDQLALDGPPRIEISPRYIPWLWLPRRAGNIEVIITAPEVAEDEGTSSGDRDPDSGTAPSDDAPDDEADGEPDDEDPDAGPGA